MRDDKITHTLFFILIIYFFSLNPALSMDKEKYVSTNSDTILTPKQAYFFLRGIEKEVKNRFKFLTPFKNVMLYLPRQINYGFHYASGYGTKLMNDPKFIDNIEDFFFTDNKKLGWYPVFDMISGFRPRIGVNFIFNQNNFNFLLRGKYADYEKYKAEVRISFGLKKPGRIWRFTLSNIIEYDDDREYFGIGNLPRSDARNIFLQSSDEKDYGIFIQHFNKTEAIIGFRPFKKWEFFLINYFQTRRILDGNDNNRRITKVFDVKNIIGMNEKLSSYHSELLFRFDSHDNNKYISSGVKLEFYVGQTKFVNSYYNLLKSGFDISSSVPIIFDNRILKPRLIINTIKSLNSNDLIPFSEYPDHAAFRGASERKILRIDNYSIIPSLEYQWPLSFNLGAHLFFDQLIVAKKYKRISLKNAPWAVGIGIDFHTIDGILAQVQGSYGSEGFYSTLDIGWTIR